MNSVATVGTRLTSDNMSFNNAGYVDARYGTFIQDNRTVTSARHVNISISPLFLLRRSNRIAIEIKDNLLSPMSRLDSFSQGHHPIKLTSSGSTHDVDIATGLIAQMQLLLNQRPSSHRCRDLEFELESLRQTLTLIKCTIQRYNYTPLRQSLSNIVTPEFKLCVTTMQKLRESFADTRLDISVSIVGGLLRRFWWSDGDGDGINLLRDKLSSSRYSLLGLLIALHSCVLIL